MVLTYFSPKSVSISSSTSHYLVAWAALSRIKFPPTELLRPQPVIILLELLNLSLQFYFPLVRFCFALFSLYENEGFSAVTHPETDKWVGEMILPDFTCNQDYQVPELLLLNDDRSYDCGEPEEELLSILEEIISEDEKKNEGNCKKISLSMYA